MLGPQVMAPSLLKVEPVATTTLLVAVLPVAGWSKISP